MEHVDLADDAVSLAEAAKCADRDCLQVGMDHGPYTPGVGYTAGSSYRSRLVCLRRHLRGCPLNSVCPSCRTLAVDGPGARCDWCQKDVTVELEERP